MVPFLVKRHQNSWKKSYTQLITEVPYMYLQQMAPSIFLSAASSGLD